MTSLALSGCAIEPERLDSVELASFIKDKRSRVMSDQEPLRGPLTERDAIVRALRYNLDKEIELMQHAVAERQLHLAHYSMLPGIVADSGYANRDNYSGGISVQILGPKTLGPQSLTSSTSSERDVRSADIRFSWNILDFGLSYVRAKQAADKVLIAEEAKMRVVNRIAENVRTAYWRAVAATRLLERLGRLDRRVRNALSNTEGLLAKGESSPLTTLTYERELVEIQRDARRLQAELSTAKAQLAALINIDPGQDYRIAIPPYLRMPGLPRMAPAEMVSFALHNRSEMREAVYQKRINIREAEAAILEMLPGIGLDAGPHWNSNTFLFNSNWIAWGAQASWNVIKVFSYPARRDGIEAEAALLDARARAVTMAIMTQVHVARARIYFARRSYESASHYLDVQGRIMQQIRSSLSAGKVSEQTAIREEMNTVVATVKRDIAYAELQSAVAGLNAAMGRVPDDIAWRTEVAQK
jgi:outer membrane protein TolC